MAMENLSRFRSRRMFQRAAAFSLFGVGAAGLLATPPLRADDACAPVLEAIHRNLMSASHAYNTQTSEARPTPVLTEAINVNNDAFVMMHGKWMRSPMTLADIRKESEEMMKKDQPVCKLLREEKFEGIDALVISEHLVNDLATIDSTFWIAKASGLPLKRDLDANRGAGKGKSHMSTRYEYVNVAPPPGVQ
jgi:hypothetical protein